MGLTGKVAEEVLGRHRMTCNKNGIPFDPEKPMITSGIRLGSPAGTTRGFGTQQFREIGNLIGTVLDAQRHHADDTPMLVLEDVMDRVADLTNEFPIY